MSTKEKTPAQKYGLRVGDRIQLTGSPYELEHFAFEKGSVIELAEDDGSRNPWFRPVEGQGQLRRGIKSAEALLSFSPDCYDGLFPVNIDQYIWKKV
jgi:hypothetical protein